jgi:hypothetical protein
MLNQHRRSSRQIQADEQPRLAIRATHLRVTRPDGSAWTTHYTGSRENLLQWATGVYGHGTKVETVGDVPDTKLLMPSCETIPSTVSRGTSVEHVGEVADTKLLTPFRDRRASTVSRETGASTVSRGTTASTVSRLSKQQRAILRLLENPTHTDADMRGAGDHERYSTIVHRMGVAEGRKYRSAYASTVRACKALEARGLIERLQWVPNVFTKGAAQWDTALRLTDAGRAVLLSKLAEGANQ